MGEVVAMKSLIERVVGGGRVVKGRTVVARRRVSPARH